MKTRQEDTKRKDNYNAEKRKMEITIYDDCTGTGSFHAGKPRRAVCADLVARRENIITADAGNIGTGGLSAYVAAESAGGNYGRPAEPKSDFHCFRYGNGNHCDAVCAFTVGV